MANEIEEDEPLDPVMEKVRVKMVRLLGISIGLMLLALITVLGAVVYKISQGSGDVEEEVPSAASTASQVSDAPLLETINVDLPEGARIVSSSFSSNRMMLDIRTNDGERVFWIVDLQSGDVISKVNIK